MPDSTPGRTPWDSTWPPSARIPGHGIIARSRRGAFATTWWGRRFVDAMEAAAGQARLTRGRTYARAGQVLGLAVEPGSVTASVQGSRIKPYRVLLRFDTWDASDLQELATALASSPATLAAVLGGAMPAGFEELCGQVGLALFPASLADARFDCTCPDLGDPCKHAAAVVYLLAEWLDEQPFGVLTLRGARREELLARVCAARESARPDPNSDPDPAQIPPAAAAFYARSSTLLALEPSPGRPGRTVLDDLDAGVLGPGGELVAGRLRCVLAALGPER